MKQEHFQKFFWLFAEEVSSKSQSVKKQISKNSIYKLIKKYKRLEMHVIFSCARLEAVLIKGPSFAASCAENVSDTPLRGRP